MSQGKTGNSWKRRGSEFAHITTLVGMTEHEKHLFSFNNRNHFFRVLLWDTSHICAGCQLEIADIKEATLDHIFPKSKGGHTRLTNLQLMHSKCNGDKRNKIPKRYSWKARIPTKGSTNAMLRQIELDNNI